MMMMNIDRAHDLEPLPEDLLKALRTLVESGTDTEVMIKIIHLHLLVDVIARIGDRDALLHRLGSLVEVMENDIRYLDGQKNLRERVARKHRSKQRK
jgi:hypothetical protein